MTCHTRSGVFALASVALALLLAVPGVHAQSNRKSTEPLMLVVMDPLAKELACACVKGHGQRDYRKLAAKIRSTINRPVSIEFSDDLAETLALASPGQGVIVIGDRSLVTHGAAKARFNCQPVCELTDPEGNTTLAASIVVRSDDPAKELKDLAGRKVYFGLAEGDAKRTAALAALRSAGVQPGPDAVTRGTYTDAALDVLDSTSKPPPFAIIPGYGVALLEGCGSVKPRELRVIGKSEPAPFITAFIGDSIDAKQRDKILKVLIGLKSDKKLLQAMESKEGFKELKPVTAAGNRVSASADWPDWRGRNRDGHVARLPAVLPEKPMLIWKRPAMAGSLAGLSVSGQRLILAERDFAEEHDVYRCLNAETGETMWSIQFPAPGKLDYGQSPRATPVIEGERAYLLGAFGDLRCVSVNDGDVLWERKLPREFKAELPTWGMCSTPLLVDDLVIVNPGGVKASVVALDKKTGRTRWATPGAPAAYSAFIQGEFGGRRQIVGYDRNSLGGWDVKTGTRLWRLEPPSEGDFNVPTPIPVEGGLVLSTENNGTRLYHFDRSGLIIPKPVAVFADLAPDCSTPVATGGRIFGAHQSLRCLDARNGLKQVWSRDMDSIGDYATVIADDERVLVITLGGELILLDARADECAILSRTKLFEEDVEVYSHPALVGTRLFARGGEKLVCVDLGATNLAAQ